MSSYQKLLNWIDSQQDAMTQLVWNWAGINSGTFNPTGLATQAEFIAAEFDQFAETTRLREPEAYEVVDDHGHLNPVALGKNLHVVQRPDAPVRALLSIHMDTVYGPDSNFQTVRQIDTNTICGPGVADAKGGLVVMLFALRAVEKFMNETQRNRLGWDVIVNSDEEIGSPGSTALFEEVSHRVQLGLLFEPSLPDGSLISSRKGAGNFSITAHGRAAHAGRNFYDGVNAIVAAAEVSIQLHRLSGQWDEMTLNIARIDGGGPSNMVPPIGVIRLNIRYVDREHEAQILKTIREILDGVEQHSGVRFELHGHFSSPPKPDSPGLELLLQQIRQCGQEIGLDLSWSPSGGACDGNRLAAFGVPSVDTLGVRGGKIHSSEEFMLLDSLRERTKLTALFLMQLADGTVRPPLPETSSRVE